MLGKTKSSLLPAYGLITALLTLILISNTAYSQEYSALDSLKIGSTYKIILFDDTEIIGKIIQNDSEFVTVNTGVTNRNIKKDDIFNVSRDLTPSQYKYIFSGGGGVSFLSNGFFNNDHNQFSPLFSVQLAATFLTSSSKGFRIDLGYSRFKKKNEYNWYTDFNGGDMGMFSFKSEFVIGELSPSSPFNAYGSIGLGVNFSKEEETTYRYYSSWDSSYYESKNPERSTMNLLLSLGGGLSYRFSKHIGAYVDVQYEMLSLGGYFFFYGFGAGYFPVRAGITYYLYQ